MEVKTNLLVIETIDQRAIVVCFFQLRGVRAGAAKGVMVDRKRRVAEVRVAVVSAAAGMAVVVTGEEKGGARVEAAVGEMGAATEVQMVVVMEEVAEVATA